MNNTGLIPVVNAGQTQVKADAGYLHGLIINKTTGSALKLYDSAGVNDLTTLFATIASGALVGANFLYSGKLTKGLLIINGDAVKATQTLTSDATIPTAADTVTIGNKVYTFRANLTGTAASATLTSDTVQPTVGDLVVVNDRTYRFATTLAHPQEVKIGADADTTLANLVKAINGTGTPQTEYATGTLAATGVTAAAVGSHATVVTANALGVAGNLFPKSETSSHLDWDGTGAFFTGGVNTIANEVLLGISAATALDNLKQAINQGDSAYPTAASNEGVGVKWSTGTIRHTQVIATTNTDTTQVVQAINYGTAPNAFATTETSSHLSWGATTLASGSEGTAFDITASIE